MSTGRVFHCRIALGKTVCACIALNLYISCLEPSGADGNWFKVGCSRYGDETISDSLHRQDPAASSSWSCKQSVTSQIFSVEGVYSRGTIYQVPRSRRRWGGVSTGCPLSHRGEVWGGGGYCYDAATCQTQVTVSRTYQLMLKITLTLTLTLTYTRPPMFDRLQCRNNSHCGLGRVPCLLPSKIFNFFCYQKN